MAKNCNVVVELYNGAGCPIPWSRSKTQHDSFGDAKEFIKAFGRRGTYRAVNLCTGKVIGKFRKK